MLLPSIQYIALALAAYVTYRIVWAIYGQTVLSFLLPNHYKIWDGTQRPPATRFRQNVRYVLSLFTSDDATDHLLDIGFVERTKTVGNTFLQSGRDLITVEPANLQAMLATQFNDFATGPLRRSWLYPLIGDSIFTSDGTFWEHSRALFRSQFARDNINNLDATAKAASDLIAACGSTNSQGWTEDIDLSPLFYNFTLDTATEFLFGESINSQETAVRKAHGYDDLDGKLTAANDFRSALELVNTRIMWRMRFGLFYYLVDGLDFRRAIRYIRSWTERYVQLALASSADPQIKGTKSNVLSALALQCKNPSELRNQTLAIMFAGRDTTASLLGWIFRELAVHPVIFDKLRRTILQDFPPGRDISFAQLKSCRYLQHVISESLRLHPTVPLNTRVAVRDTTLPVGGGADGQAPIAIPKGQNIFFSVYVMHRRKDLWGEDALVFRPERWEERVPAWQFLPFLGGPRICLGQQFALTEAGYLLVRMLQHFDRLEPVDYAETARMRKTLGVTMAVKGGVHVRLRRAV